MNKKTVSPTHAWLLIPAAFGHPIYLFIAMGITGGLGFYEAISTNVARIYFLPFVIICLGLAGARFLVVIVLRFINVKPPVSKEYLFLRFCKNHKALIPGLLLFPVFVIPMEGNILGFIIMPVVFLTGAVLGGYVLKRNLELTNEDITAASVSAHYRNNT